MRLKYDYSVISVIVDSLPGNTKNRESTRSWLIGARLFHLWADTYRQRQRVYTYIERAIPTDNTYRQRDNESTTTSLHIYLQTTEYM